jgi:hypothetical protein
MTCEAPRVVAVRNERYTVPCGSRYCPACGVRWAKDQRIRAVAAARDLPGDCALLTITGPGNAYFGAVHSPLRAAVAARKRMWNRDAPERWQALHREASRLPRAHARADGCDWRVLYRTWEWQKRRVKHLHLVVPYGTEAEQAATDEYVSRLHAAARRHGFGFVLGGDSQDEPSWAYPPRVLRMEVNAVAAYVSKYVSKAGNPSNGMVSIARAQGMRGSVLYVAPHLLQRSGVSMTSLRSRRRIVSRWPWAKSSERSWEAARVVDAVQRGRPPLTEAAVATIRAHAEDHPPTYVLEHATGALTTPTVAPMPPGTGGYAARDPGGRVVLHLVLASVLLRVPEPENLGSWRTEVTEVTWSRL